MTEDRLQELITAWLDGRLTEEGSEDLQQQLRDSTRARAKFRAYTQLDAALHEIAEGDHAVESASKANLKRRSGWRFGFLAACAAAMMCVIGGTAYYLGKSEQQSNVLIAASPDESLAEQTMPGYATLRRVAGIRWKESGRSFRVGDVLPAGVFEFEQGVAEIDFFCGATLVVEGPAKMELESDWSVRFHNGRLRAKVPPAARGFVVRTDDSEIVDLGTEFALEVAPESVRVEVIDGEIKLEGGLHDGDHLTTGQGLRLKGSVEREGPIFGVGTLDDLLQRHLAAQGQRYTKWQAHSSQLQSDQRLIAYYPIARSLVRRSVKNAALSGVELDAALVGLVNSTEGRFGPDSLGLEFDRPGSRVRARIDGEFTSFTFATWTKIDSLEHVYNALFMADGYENGEPHWQIRQDGRLMFSVMVDDSQEVHVTSIHDQRLVRDAGLHRVYFSEPFWDVSKSGQWFHLVAVYDPVGRRVNQYVNGQRISSEPILDKFYVNELRIGPAEIGNWGQPFRQSAWFAIRNLNGTIDELAIYNAALTEGEIQQLYQQGKPLGY